MFADIKRASFKHKNNKPKYYVLNNVRRFLPKIIYRKNLYNRLKNIKNFDPAYIQKRVDYYNRLDIIQELSKDSVALSDFKLRNYRKTYFFDTLEYTRYFSPDLKIRPVFGDITSVPEYPSIVKSRPIEGDNKNSVLLKLNKIRHFIFIKDKKEYIHKKNMLVSRSKAGQENRIRFLNMYFNNPICNIGQVNRNINPQFIVNRMTLEEHLDYKFILCLEGNDVASNLKWVMSSNSLAVMTKPKYETWFMEGTLIPDYHYVLIKDDFSDLEERLNYYIEHTDEALQIIENAHRYIEQFKHKEQEDLISLLVLKKYFEKTNQE